jgi:hypothetical protein
MKSSILSVVVLTLLSAIGGQCYSAELKVEAISHTQRAIYHSPETPGYTAWVGLWQLPNGTIQTDFVQATGPQNNPVITNPVLQSTDACKTWTRVPGDVPTGYSRGMAVLPNGTMVRPAEVDVFGPDPPRPGGVLIRRDKFMGVQRSSDGGKTWSQSINLVSPTDYRVVYPTVIRALRDGRLVAFAGLVASNVGPQNWQQKITKTMFISSDEGKSWSKPIVVMPNTVGACEESDFCELPNGNLFWVHRALSSPHDRMQSIVRKQGETFIPGTCKPASLRPYGGFPLVLYTNEGIILHFDGHGVYWTADLGETWTRLNIPGTPYYPQALQLADGKILCVGHLGADNVYGTFDQCIVEQTFRLRVTRSGDARKSNPR